MISMSVVVSWKAREMVIESRGLCILYKRM